MEEFNKVSVDESSADLKAVFENFTSQILAQFLKIWSKYSQQYLIRNGVIQFQ